MLIVKKSKNSSRKTKRRYRALSSLYQTHSSVGKIPYSGPKSFRAIIDAIIDDGKEIGLDLSYNFVYRVIRLFFKAIFKHMYKKNYISIEGFGDFGMTPKMKKELIARDEGQREKKKEYLRAKRKRACYLNSLKKRRMKTLDKMNQRRAAINLKPLSYELYVKFTSHKKPRKLKVKPIINYTFDILDTQSKTTK